MPGWSRQVVLIQADLKWAELNRQGWAGLVSWFISAVLAQGQMCCAQPGWMGRREQGRQS